MEKIILAGGCFWCTEAIFASLKGVVKVIPGYSGGKIEDPTYWQVASGESGHAECVEITFDPKTIKLRVILEIFFKLHNPTELNKQGADVGTQYRSAIFFTTSHQKEVAEKALFEAQKNYKPKIVTEITEFKSFFEAEPEHKDYYLKNKGNVYCSLVIDPKINKLRESFGSRLK